ncbi:microtubule-associated protein RP/EB family member 3 [Ditylenchus destructor]|nr:microtubule-associated protein RP/EB family member 3 [Ditylenchus destructor]
MGDGHPDTYRGPVQQTKIEEMSTGAAYCQLTDLLFLKRILLKKVKWNCRLEVDWLNNWRVLQAAWKDIGVDRPVTIQSLMKAKFQDNVEFLQWFKTNMESLSPPLRELISRLCASMVLQRIHSCAETCVDSTSQLSEVQKLVAKLMHLIYNEDLETYKLLLRYHDSPKSKQMNRALKTLPHIINGEKVSAKGSKQDELILRVLNLSPETTKESLREFYSRFGGLNKCDVKKNSETGESMIGYVSSFASQKEQQYFNDVYGSQFPSLWSIAKSVLLCFVNGNEFFEMPRPISNKIIHIGGIASDVFEKSPAKKVTLSSEVQSVFDNAKDGVVLFSFGTITNTKAMTHQMKTAFLKAFAQFPSKQNAILAQPKLKIRTVARVMRVTELPDTITYQCCDTCEAEPDKTGVEDWFPIIRYFGVDDTMKREVLDVGTVVLAFGKLRTFSSKASIVSFHVIKLDAPEQEIAIFQKEAELHPLRGLFLRNYLLTSRPNTLQADTSSISEMNDFC